VLRISGSEREMTGDSRKLLHEEILILILRQILFSWWNTMGKKLKTRRKFDSKFCRKIPLVRPRRK
jgi:hypothetical protein